LNEWAQETSVRDLYGAAPPADLPREITLMAEQENGVGPNPQPSFGEDYPEPSFTAGRWSPRRIWQKHPPRLLSSPFSLDESDHRFTPNNMMGDGNEMNPEQQNGGHALMQPLLPAVEANGDDEEVGESLLGEAFLPVSMTPNAKSLQQDAL
jgi:hypothetical protein